MTTDTAARVTRLVVEGKSLFLPETLVDPANHISAPLQDVPYVDFPELKFNEHESTQMPFRYVKSDDGMPIMPKVSIPSYPVYRCHADSLGNGGLDQERCRQGYRRPFLILPLTS